MLNFFLLIFVICLAVFFLNLYFQLVKIENQLKSDLERIEHYLAGVYGVESPNE